MGSFSLLDLVVNTEAQRHRVIFMLRVSVPLCSLLKLSAPPPSISEETFLEIFLI